MLAANLLFAESFESGVDSNHWSNRWVEDGQDAWYRSSQAATDGSYSAQVRGNASDATLTLVQSIDLTGNESAQLNFDWQISNGLDSGEYLALDISSDGGASWINNVRQLRGDFDAENAWHSQSVDLSDYASSDVLLRFRSLVDRRNEIANVDNVQIVSVMPDLPLIPTISFPDFSNPDGLHLVNAASAPAGADASLELTPARPQSNGASWFNEKQSVANAWETTFDFRLGGGAGFAFVIQNHDPQYVSDHGASLGYLNLPNSVAIEFDTYENFQLNDPSHSHISVHTLGTSPNSHEESASLGSYNTPSIMDDGDVHTAKISYRPGTMEIFLDDLINPVLEVPLDLSTTLDLDAGRAWVGFTSSTGANAEKQEILNWDYGLRTEPTTLVFSADSNVVEGDSSGTQLSFPVTARRLGDVSSPSSVQIAYSTADVTAQDGGTGEDSDYLAAGGSITFDFAAGESELTQTINVAVNSDTIEEDFETFQLNLSASADATLAANSATGTIQNDDSSVSIADAVSIEGSNQFGVVERFVTTNSSKMQLRGLSLGPDGNGDGHQDLYVVSRSQNEVLRFDGVSGKPIDVFVDSGAGGLVDPIDLRFGPDGNLYVTSGGSNRYPESNEILRFDGQTGTFIDVAVSGLQEVTSFDFGDGGHLYAASAATDSIEIYDVVNAQSLGTFISNAADNLGSAVFGEDLTGDGVSDLYVTNTLPREIIRYDGASGALIDTISLPASNVSMGRMDVGNDGSIYVSYVDYVSTDAPSGRTTILKLDGSSGEVIDEVSLERSGVTVMVDENDVVYVSGDRGLPVVDRIIPASAAVFDVSLSRASALPISVDFLSSDDVAAAGLDYEAVAGTLTFAPGQTSRSIVVPTIDDTEVEADEVFRVSLTNAQGTQLGDAEGSATILDDDSIQPSTNPLYVANIAFQSRRGGKQWRVLVEVRADSNGNGQADDGDDLVANANVTVQFAGKSLEGTTGGNGVFQSDWVSGLDSSVDYYANVTDLALTGYDEWNPLWLDLEDDSDGDGNPDELLLF